MPSALGRSASGDVLSVFPLYVEQMRSWRVSDFKSIGSATLNLDGKRLSLLAGSNSSGKSSLLQSLLLLAQSIHRDGSITLNGRLVRLGEAEDIIRHGQRTMTLTLELGASQQASQTQAKLTLEPSTDGLQVASFEITDDQGSFWMDATTSHVRTDDSEELQRIVAPDIQVLRVRSANGEATRRTYLIFQGLLPIAVARHLAPTAVKRAYTDLFNSIFTGDQPGRNRSLALSELSVLVPKQQFFAMHGLEVDQRIPAPLQRRWSTRDLGELTDDVRQDLVVAASERRSNLPWILRYVDPYGPGFSRIGLLESGATLLEDGIVTLISSVYEELTNLGDEVSYLGPLREEPRVTQDAWDERTSGLPVGARGELSAEVLNRLQGIQLNYFDWLGQKLDVPLVDAVSRWCEYLGVGSNVGVTDYGKLGRGVQLRVGGADRDLTAIGVGASQLLPVVVALLTAPEDAVLCIEQPELHLHPAVQARLADLFLFARPDVHSVIETHSEYLLTRVRRRVAEQSDLAAAVDVVFVQQEHGISKFDHLALDQYGDFDQWPAGFFDTQEDEAMELVRVISEKLEK